MDVEIKTNSNLNNINRSHYIFYDLDDVLKDFTSTSKSMDFGVEVADTVKSLSCFVHAYDENCFLGLKNGLFYIFTSVLDSLNYDSMLNILTTSSTSDSYQFKFDEKVVNDVEFKLLNHDGSVEYLTFNTGDIVEGVALKKINYTEPLILRAVRPTYPDFDVNLDFTNKRICNVKFSFYNNVDCNIEVS